MFIFFLFLHKNMFYGYSSEVPHRGASNKHINICFCREIRKIIIWILLLSSAMCICIYINLWYKLHCCKEYSHHIIINNITMLSPFLSDLFTSCVKIKKKSHFFLLNFILHYRRGKLDFQTRTVTVLSTSAFLVPPTLSD